MKYLLILLLLFSLNSYAQLDSICNKRGHCFQIEEFIISNSYPYYGPTMLWQQSILGNKNQELDTLYKIIDVKDSSYIVYNTPSEIKYCYRCKKNIEFKQDPRYIRTIWKRKDN